MVDTLKTSVMRQKAGQGRPPPEIPPLTAQKALEDAMVFAADATEGLIITPQEVVESRVLLSSFHEDLSGHSFLSIVEGPRSIFGVIAADIELVSALIQIQTMGVLSAKPASERPVTQTDAAMCADFFDRVLERFEHEITRVRLPDVAKLSGYRFAFHVNDLRALRLALADIPYRAFRLRFALGEKGREGSLMLVLPQDAPVQPPSADRKRLGAQAHAPAEVVMQAQADLAAILCRKRLSLQEVSQFEPGQVIPISKDALGSVWLEDLTGQQLAKCRLGQAKGMRALRIGAEPSSEPMPDVLALGAVSAPIGGPIDTAMDLPVADPLGESLGDPAEAALDMEMTDLNLDAPPLDVDAAPLELDAAPLDLEEPRADVPDVGEGMMSFPEVDLPTDFPEVDFGAEPLPD